MHISTVIEQLGYPKSEVQLYLAALGMEEATIAELARKVGLPRTSVQTIIASMHRKGIMQYYVHKRRKYWTAENPDKLMITLKEHEVALRAILPELKARRSDTGIGKPTVRSYFGEDEIRLIMDDMIAAQRHVFGVVAWDEWRALFGDEFIDEFVRRRREHHLSIRILTPRTPYSLDLKRNDERDLRHTRFWPRDVEIHNSNFIYGDKVAIISLNKARPMGTVIEDADIAHTMTVLFESLWVRGEG